MTGRRNPDSLLLLRLWRPHETCGYPFLGDEMCTDRLPKDFNKQQITMMDMDERSPYHNYNCSLQLLSSTEPGAEEGTVSMYVRSGFLD